MTTDHKNDEINKGFGIGVGLVLSGIFMLNIPYFFTNISSFSNALLDIFGVAFFIIGILGVLIELGKKEGNAWLDDFGIGVFIFLSVFIPFILIHNSIIKSIFALLSILGFIFLGYALGTSFLDDDGNMRFHISPTTLLDLMIKLLTITTGMVSIVLALQDTSLLAKLL